jgi:WXG100 family type VII secretion target
VLESTAKKFEGINSELATMLSNLMAELDALKSAWQGAGGRSFAEVKRKWSEDQDKIHKALAQTAEAIRTSGKTYASTDANTAQTVSASGAANYQIMPL